MALRGRRRFEGEERWRWSAGDGGSRGAVGGRVERRRRWSSPRSRWRRARRWSCRWRWRGRRQQGSDVLTEEKLGRQRSCPRQSTRSGEESSAVSCFVCSLIAQLLKLENREVSGTGRRRATAFASIPANSVIGFAGRVEGKAVMGCTEGRITIPVLKRNHSNFQIEG